MTYNVKYKTFIRESCGYLEFMLTIKFKLFKTDFFYVKITKEVGLICKPNGNSVYSLDDFKYNCEELFIGDNMEKKIKELIKQYLLAKHKVKTFDIEELNKFNTDWNNINIVMEGK